MSRNFFRENRKRVQQNILDSNFLLPLVANTSICIEEKKQNTITILKKSLLKTFLFLQTIFAHNLGLLNWK